MQRRGTVYISPVEPVPADGSMIDPETARFWASWQDEDADRPLEEAELEDGEAAIAWGRERSPIVFIRLGNRGDTYLSAGEEHVADDDDQPIPHWPPAGPPPGGWWEPPTSPSLDEISLVKAEVASGERSAEDAAQWASDRIRPAIEAGASEIEAALVELSAGVEFGAEF